MKSKEINSNGFLLENRWYRERRSWIIYMIVTFPTICLFIVVLLFYLRKKREYDGIKGLRDAQKDYALKDIVSKKVVFADQGFAHIFAIYAMADLDCDGCAFLIYQLYTKPRPTYVSHDQQINTTYSIIQQFPGVYQIALMHIAKKRGVTFNDLLVFLETEKKKSTIRDLQEQLEPTTELSIPITKTYILDAIPKDKQDMISSLPLDFDNDDIIACPHCGNMTEKNLMAKWLKEKSTCPICKKMIEITDCPLVIIRD